MEPSPPDRRKTPRIDLFELAILEPESQEPIGLLLDISLSGARTLCSGTLVVGARHRFRMELTEGIVDGDSVEVEATVRWCKRARIPRHSIVGWEFSGILPIEVSRAIGAMVLAVS